MLWAVQCTGAILYFGPKKAASNGVCAPKGKLVVMVHNVYFVI